MKYNSIIQNHILNTEIQINSNKLQIYYHKYHPEFILDLQKECMSLYSYSIFHHQKLIQTIDYHQIDTVQFSLKQRNYGTVAGMIINEYHLDIQIKTKDSKLYHLESQSYQNLDSMFKIFKHYHIHIDDPLDIYHNYLKDGQKYLQNYDKQFYH